VATRDHEKLESLFCAALEKDSWAERSAFLAEACGDDSALRAHVEGLLSAHERVGSFLDVPAVDPDATLKSQPTNELIGTRIGHYRLLQEIGEGGFGVVYLAEQEQPVRRKVALKIIKLGMDTREVIARFEAERQALALMDHPNIARVLDGGATEAGRPYFVMELVKGVRITNYCDEHKLPLAERLRLFLPVCHAIQHAHQKGIIHRDLKPSNVLVTIQDDQPVAKVIDFGIAKATSQRLTEKTLFTGFQQFLGTPEYMSPDQLAGGALDVDTRTDIYSLGVLLYELLVGATPFDSATLRQSSFDEIKRIIREVEPPKLTLRVQTLLARGPDIAVRRQCLPAALPRLLHGDLDWITMKALEKDRTRRYATAKDLADDIERHLRHEPVVAGPPGVTYRVGKFIRRHRVGVLASAIVIAALLSGLSLATTALIQVNRARDALEFERDAAQQARVRAQEHQVRAEAAAAEARKQADRSATINAFLQEMLRSVDPSQALGREVSVRYALDEAARKIEQGALAAQPEVEAAIRMTLGETYAALGLYPVAETHLRAAQETQVRVLGAEHHETLRASRALAGVLRVRGQFAEAEALLRATAATQRRVLGEEHPDTLATMTELALALWGPGRFEEAEVIHRQTLGIQQRVLGEEDRQTIESAAHLGAVCRVLGRLDEAERLLQRALDLSRRTLGEEHPTTADVLTNLGLLREDQRDSAAAEAVFRRAYEIDCQVLGTDHPRTLIAMNNLLRVLQVAGNLDAIRPLIAERLARLQRAAERPTADAAALHAYAWELLHCEPADLRDAQAALPVARRAVELDGGQDAGLLETLALAYRANGDLRQAVDAQRRALAQARAGGPYDRKELEAQLAEYLFESGDFVAAASASWEGLAARLGPALNIHPAPGADVVRRSEALLRDGRYDEAVALLRGCVALREKSLPAGSWLIAETNSQLGAALAASGKLAEAEPLLLGACAALVAREGVPVDNQRRAVSRVVRLYETWGKPAQATEWRQKLEALSGAARDGG